jgi:hypothetical protein
MKSGSCCVAVSAQLRERRGAAGEEWESCSTLLAARLCWNLRIGSIGDRGGVPQNKKFEQFGAFRGKKWILTAFFSASHAGVRCSSPTMTHPCCKQGLWLAPASPVAASLLRLGCLGCVRIQTRCLLPCLLSPKRQAKKSYRRQFPAVPGPGSQFASVRAGPSISPSVPPSIRPSMTFRPLPSSRCRTALFLSFFLSCSPSCA